MARKFPRINCDYLRGYNCINPSFCSRFIRFFMCVFIEEGSCTCKVITKKLPPIEFRY